MTLYQYGSVLSVYPLRSLLLSGVADECLTSYSLGVL